MTFGEQNTEKEAHEMLSYSFEHGINALDTAEAVSHSYFTHTHTHIYIYICIYFELKNKVLDFMLQYPVPMRKETQGRTDVYISSWLKSQPRDKVLA